MRKLLALLLAGIMALSLMACNNTIERDAAKDKEVVDEVKDEKTEGTNSELNTESRVEVEIPGSSSEDSEDGDTSDYKEELDDLQNQLDDLEDFGTDGDNADSSVSDSEWKQFLKDYEALVDDYIELYKKEEANPDDISLISEANEMMSKVEEYNTKSNEIAQGLAGTEASVEFASELLRIANKVVEVME